MTDHDHSEPYDKEDLHKGPTPTLIIKVVVAAVVLSATTLGPVYFFRFHFAGGLTDPWEDDPFVVGVFTSIYLLALVAFVFAAVSRRINWWTTSLFLGLGVLAVASAAWSEVPGMTLRRGLLFLGTTLLGISIGAFLNSALLLRALVLGMGLCTAASAVLAVKRPGWGTQPPAGDWSGMYFNRNSLAPVAALALLCALLLIVDSRSVPVRIASAFCIAVSVVVLAKTGGVTAMAATFASLVACGAAIVYGRLSARLDSIRAVTLGSAVTLVVVAILAWLTRAQLLDLIGKTPTLENRTPLWSFTIDQIAQQPLLGYGFYTHWSAPLTAYATFQALRWVVPTAHNGFLETFLGLGIGGLALLILCLVTVMCKSIQLAIDRHRVSDLTPITLITFMIVMNLTESFVLPNQVLWVIVPASLGVCISKQVNGTVSTAGNSVRSSPMEELMADGS